MSGSLSGAKPRGWRLIEKRLLRHSFTASTSIGAGITAFLFATRRPLLTNLTVSQRHRCLLSLSSRLQPTTSYLMFFLHNLMQQPQQPSRQRQVCMIHCTETTWSEYTPSTRGEIWDAAIQSGPFVPCSLSVC